MNATQRAVAVAVALGCLLSAPARAQPAPGDVEAQAAVQARQRFEAGVALFQEGNPQGALLEFEASMRLRPVAVVQFNIAQALKVLLRYEDAIVAYRLYLRMGESEISAERRQDVEVTIARLQRSIAHLMVTCGPDGGEVRVDGHPVGELPLGVPVSIAAGRHDVEVRAHGYTSATRSIEVVGGASVRVCIELRALDLRGGRAEASSGILGRWWFWTAAGAMIAGGVTAAALLLSSSSEGEPYRGNVDPSLVTAVW